MPKPSEGPRERFEALRRAYLAELPARIASIRRIASDAAGPGEGAAAARETLQQLVHQLLGSTAIFGLSRVYASARALEAVAIRLREEASSRADLDAALAALDAACGEDAAQCAPAREGERVRLSS